MATASGQGSDVLVSVVIPVFNEERTIEQIIRRVAGVALRIEIIVVDDGSRDATPAILDRLVTETEGLRIVRRPVNSGKGAAVRQGIALTSGEIVVIQDADLEYDPKNLQALLAPLLEGHADVVYGTRMRGGEPQRAHLFSHYVGNRFLSLLTDVLYNTTISDMEVGYKAFRGELIRSLELVSDDFGFEPEVTAKVLRRPGVRLFELPIAYYGRTYAEGKKIGWKDGVWAVYCVVRYSRLWDRLFPANHRAGRATVTEAAAEVELADTLDSLGEADNYSDWIVSLIEPHLGDRVLEVGAGHGTITARIAPGREVVATEVSERSAQILRVRFAAQPNVSVVDGLATADTVTGEFDSVVLVNVLEHIEDDVGALRHLGALMRPGGRVILFVPAFEALYSNFDAKIGHHRRYRRSQLATALGTAGFEVDDLHYVNSLGAIAWWVVARQLRQTPTRGMAVRVYDKLVVPTLRRREVRRRPRFGQSVFCVARRPGPS